MRRVLLMGVCASLVACGPASRFADGTYVLEDTAAGTLDGATLEMTREGRRIELVAGSATPVVIEWDLSGSDGVSGAPCAASLVRDQIGLSANTVIAGKTLKWIESGCSESEIFVIESAGTRWTFQRQ
jgi:hypothetical protein